MRSRPSGTRRAAVAVTVLAAVAALPVTATAAAPHDPAPLAAHPAPAEWPTYVVTVRRGMDPAMVAGHHGIRPVHVFRTAMNGFAAPLSPDQVAGLRANPLVESVEEDGVGSSFGTPA
ncbi:MULTISPECIES: protease inhibitor I9 family protein [unclassified Streptomyces]|uniref:protease inhibitor I9 family protein n=1 Tax=unclassified Streptomyces TaxID=2593676 RepID=UPI002E34C42B|nr:MULTISPECIES: protease inhibitor I9 family protein [unclassified Streptomyces]WUC65319.1 protease inhibitor I9 family protein [Streptomyces sp. NBC_00539]